MSAQAERQRRWYANLTPEQRETRRVRQRVGFDHSATMSRSARHARAQAARAEQIANSTHEQRSAARRKGEETIARDPIRYRMRSARQALAGYRRGGIDC
jgi:hypothetical protein